MENNIKKLIQTLIKEEMDPRRPKDKAFDLAQQLSKLSPKDREKVAMIQQMISKEKMAGIKEGDTYEKMAAKGKKAGNLKQGTVRKRLRIKDGEKIPLARINKAISSLKKRKSLNDKDKKYLKALNLAKTLKTTTNIKEIATELGYLNEYGEYKSQEEKFKQELDSMFKDYRPFISLGKYAGERPDSDPLKGKGFGSLDFVVPRELPPDEFKKALDWVKSKGFEVKSQSNEYEVEFDGDRAYYPKINFHFDADKFDTE